MSLLLVLVHTNILPGYLRSERSFAALNVQNGSFSKLDREQVGFLHHNLQTDRLTGEG